MLNGMNSGENQIKFINAQCIYVIQFDHSPVEIAVEM